jgi:hypothetical protein
MPVPGKEAGVEPAELFEDSPFDPGNRSEQPVDGREALDIGVAHPEVLVLAHERFVAVFRGIDTDDGIGELVLERLDDAEQGLPCDDDIGIEKDEDIPLRLTRAVVPRAVRPVPLFCGQQGAVMLARDFRGAVGGMIVDDDHLEMLVIGALDRAQTVVECRRPVLDRDDDRHQRVIFWFNIHEEGVLR